MNGLGKIKLEFAYDGTDFHGFARQRGLRTVQGTLEGILQRTLGYPVEVFGSGRTDAGVHARAQVVHWVQGEAGPPVDRYPYLLRRSLPTDMVALTACDAPDDFHARFSVQRKTYRYTIQRALITDVFTNRYSWHIPLELDVHLMRSAAEELVGRHDFTSFCAAASPVEDKRRTIYEIRIEERGSYCDVYCTGSGFLQYMVRIIVGTLVDIGQGKMSKSMSTILADKNRRSAGQTAPPLGLSLWEVVYPTI